MNISKDFLEQTILFSLLVVEKINKLLEKTYKEDLTFYEFYSLLAVNYFGDLTMTDFAAYLGVKKQQATRVVNNLVQKKYVRRVYDESDRRVILIALTPEGKEYLSEYTKNTISLINDSVEGFSESEIKEFQKAIETINKMLHKMNA